jgi:Phosphodiester glycosidase
MAMNIPIANGWLNSEIETRLRMTNGFFYFEDGHFQCVVMARAAVSMRIVHRTGGGSFSSWVEKAAREDPRMRLIINGSYYPSPIEGNSKTPYGNVVDKLGAIFITGTSMQDAACLYLDDGKSPRWNFEIGEPPSCCTAGLGGLIPLVISGKPVDDTNRRYAKAKKYGNGTGAGRLAVAASDDGKYLLVMLQPDGSKTGLNIDQIRDKLAAAGMIHAVLLDGSDSVMMYQDSTWRRTQGRMKNLITTIGL